MIQIQKEPVTDREKSVKINMKQQFNFDVALLFKIIDVGEKWSKQKNVCP